jgi:putative RecB family exonuclease
LKELFTAQWTRLQQGVQISWEDGQEAERASAWRALEHYFSQTPIQANERPEAVEVSVAADLSRNGLPTLIGIIDLVRAGGRIVDFKVSGKTPDAQSVVHLHEVQLTCYSLLYRDATGRKESALELHHLVKTKAPKLIVTSVAPATDQQHLRLFRQIEAYQAGLERRDFVPSPGFHCAGCAYLQECRQWC